MVQLYLFISLCTEELKSLPHLTNRLCNASLIGSLWFDLIYFFYQTVLQKKNNKNIKKFYLNLFNNITFKGPILLIKLRTKDLASRTRWNNFVWFEEFSFEL
jgi:hypothetical protein